MLTTVTKRVAEAVVCGSGTGNMQPGDQAKMFLDTVAVPGLPEFIYGVVQVPVTSASIIPDDEPCAVAGIAYIIEYDTDDLLGALAELRECDILTMECTSCCLQLGEQLDAQALLIIDLTSRIEALEDLNPYLP
jgi:hypothetical protein